MITAQEKHAAYVRLVEEFDRIMPEAVGWHQYDCRICGSAVVDRHLHWRYHHSGPALAETVQALFTSEVIL